MNHEQLTRWLTLALLRHYSSIENRILVKPDRKLLLSLRTARLSQFLSRVDTDPYESEVIKIYIDGYIEDRPVDAILKQIKKRRKELYQQQWAGIEYNQPYIPVSNFVEEERDNKILKFIVCWYASHHIYKTYLKLKQGFEDRFETDELIEIVHDARSFDVADEQTLKDLSPCFQWNSNPENQTKLLYDALMISRNIALDTRLTDFAYWFGQSKDGKQIRWAGEVVDLLLLIDGLVAEYLTVHVPIAAVKPAAISSESMQLFTAVVTCFKNARGMKISQKAFIQAAQIAEGIKSQNQLPSQLQAILGRLEKPFRKL